MTDSEKLDLLIESVGEMKEDVKGLKEDMSVLKEDVSILKEEVSELKEDVRVLKKDVSVLKEEVDELKVDMSIVKIRMENEISVNIQRVAEGHLDLDRKLTEAVKSNSEIELLTLRVNKLDGEMKEVKAKIS